MTAPNDTVSIARSTSGPAGDASGAAAIFAVIATAAAGTIATPVLARNDRDPSELYTGGALPEVAEIVSSYSRQATILSRATSAAPGAYGAIDASDVTGTSLITVDAATIPYIDSEVYVIFDVGGDLGDASDGITYRSSIDGGRTFGDSTALGSSTSITVGVAHARFLLNPPTAQETALVTHANATRTALLAHFPFTTGTVHGSADTTSDDNVHAAATDTATAILVISTGLAALTLHMARGSTVHQVTQSGSSITAALASATALSAAATASGRASDAILASIALEVALEAHEASTVAHAAADATNVVSAPRPTLGTVVAGDVVQVSTTGPTLNGAGLTACFNALVAYNNSLFGGVIVAGSFDPSVLWTPLINGLDALRETQIPVIAIVEARAMADGETPTTYRIALEAEWAAHKDERVHVVAGRGRYDPATLARCGSQLKRSHLAPLGARLAALDYGESPGAPKVSERDVSRPSRFGGPLAGFRIYDDSGNLIGHDERVNPGLQPAGFGVTTSYRRVASPTAAYIFQPKNKAPSGNRAPHIAHQRVLTVVEGVLYTVLTEELESALLYEPGRSTIRQDIADGLDAQLKNSVLAEVGDPAVTRNARISSLIVEVDRNAIIDPDDPIVVITGELTTRFYVSAFSVRLQVNRIG